MNQQTMRPYEMSLWTLQDSFITVLKPVEGLFQGQVIAPKISLKNDNTQTLTFSIPMYYRDEKGELVENPLWYNTTNGNLLANLRKIKVIFNKGEKGEGVYEFVIHKVTESHSGGKLICEVEAEGLAFQELGKIGYKITLNYDEFLLDAEEDTALLATLNYWAEKLFKNTNWTYSIQMDWSSYDGVIDLDDNGNIIDYENLTQEEKDNLNSARESEPNCLRRRDKIYEEEYVSSWKDNNGKLVPREIVQFQEKARIPQIEKSNIYNATQDLAELFEVYCKYKYYYDDNYHIIGRECIFYNNFLDESAGKFDINYPYHTNDIRRTLESTDVITKMFVEKVEDVSIMDVAANKSKEDYILNFDYLYSIGTITQEQYDSIEDYTYQMHILNSNYETHYGELSQIDLDLVDLKAEYVMLLNSIAYDLEQISLADDLLAAITNGEGILEKTELAPEKVMILKDSSSDTFKINLSLEGIITDTVKLYSNYEAESGASDEIVIGEENFVYDNITSVNLIGFTNLPVDDTGFAYLVCSYSPKTKYDNIKAVYSQKHDEDTSAIAELDSVLADLGFEYFEEEFHIIEDGRYDSLEKEIKEIQENMALARADFERMMGPALREGSWTPEEDYSDSGDKYSQTFSFEHNEGLINAFWDSELFDEELNSYYEEGVLLEKVYYPAINLQKVYNETFIENENDLVFRVFVPYDDSAESDGEETFLKIGAQLQYAFLKKENIIYPVLLITEVLTDEQIANLSKSSLGTIEVDSETGEMIFSSLIKLQDAFLENDETYSIVYPRIEVRSGKLKTTEDELSIYQNDMELEKYSQYTLLERDGWYYITIKPSIYINEALIDLDGNNSFSLNLKNNIYNINYVISNAALRLYLDALEVSRTNAYPQASYEVSVLALNENFLKYAYQKLNKVANINDEELKFKNIQGYVSEVNMELDSPWNDSFVIQNYKTKFEDLFSRIVASTEQMKSNQFAYNRAAAAFTTNGSLSSSIIQSTLNNVDLKYSFNQGELTIDEANGIWATSDAGVVAMRGGGIFCATERDSNNNWLWHSGITPKGINASLLQAGTIDTNLIRIYSGENVRFQMNGEGLFAYAETANGGANFDKYVVHNNEGLFLTEILKKEDETSEKINKVEISWDGLIIRNEKLKTEDKRVFYADENGNLQIVGTITAQTGGNIAGWEIKDTALTSTHIDGEKTYSIGLSSSNDTSVPVIWAGQKTQEGAYPFSVMMDGTLYATNAFISGTISANTVIGGLYNDTSADNSLGKAVRKLDVVALGEGNQFKYSNLNLDGNITLDPEWLRFQIRQTNIHLENWKFERWDGKTLIVGENGQEIEAWEEIKDVPTTPSSSADLYFESFNHLTFIVKYGIMMFGKEDSKKNHDLVYFRVSGTQEEAVLDKEGQITGETTTQTYSTTFSLRNKHIATDKMLSQFNPPSHTFIISQKLPAPETKIFQLTAKNIQLSEGQLTVEGEVVYNAVLISGISEVTDAKVTRDDSSLVLVPAESLENGKWFINDREIKNGDIIEGTENADAISIVNNPDGTSTISIAIPPEAVEEGGQILIRYQLGSASRTAFAFKVRNAVDNIITQITSSAGTIFKNGSIKTKLTVNLYEGQLLLNESEDAEYGYIWKMNGEILLDGEADNKKYLNKRTISVEDNDFEDKAIYTCEVYSTKQEATDEYNKYLSAFA